MGDRVFVYNVSVAALLEPAFPGLPKLYAQALAGSLRRSLNHGADTDDPDYSGQHHYRRNWLGRTTADPGAACALWLPVWPDGLFYAATVWLSSAERGAHRGRTQRARERASAKLKAAEGALASLRRELGFSSASDSSLGHKAHPRGRRRLRRGGGSRHVALQQQQDRRRALKTLPFEIVLRWLFAQPSWRQPGLARRHLFFLEMNNNVRLHAHLGAVLLRSGVGFLAVEDRIAVEHQRGSHRERQRTTVVPYYANRRVWWAPEPSDQSDQSDQDAAAAQRTTPLAYAGRARVHCKLDAALCDRYNGTAVRRAIVRAVRKLGGTVVDPSAFSGAPLTGGAKGAVAAAYRRTQFCIVPMGDVYSSKRLYSIVLSLCVPIIVSDRLPLPFAAASLPQDARVDWAAFALRVSEATVMRDAVAALGAAMRGVTCVAGRLAAMRRALSLARHKLLFTTHDGMPGAPEQAGAAVDPTEAAMQRRVLLQVAAHASTADAEGGQATTAFAKDVLPLAHDAACPLSA